MEAKFEVSGRWNTSILVKLLGSALLMSISIFLLFPGSTGFFVLAAASNTEKDPHLMERTNSSRPLLPEMALHVTKEDSRKEQCELFSGEWISNPSGPAYNASCKFIGSRHNCVKNGRPDAGYLNWKWKPYGCDLLPFDAEKFLKAMRNKALAMIGDSIFSNHVESLICLLVKVEEPTEIYHDKEYQSRTWYFPSHNFTLACIWAPFLLAADIAEVGKGVYRYDIQLHLDSLDKTWTSQYHKYDYIVISGGQWYLKTAIYLENNTVVGCHNCPGKSLRELGYDYSYRKALQLAFRYITSSDHKPLVMVRTWTPDHFEYGEWHNGGLCNRTEPYEEGQVHANPVDHVMRSIEIDEFEKAAAIGSENGTRLKLLDTYHLSVLRPDGHPGPYRKFHPDLSKKPQNDCLHWCLPGPLETWNELIMNILQNEGDLRFAS